MLKLDSKTKELEAKRVNFRLRRVVKWTEWCDIGNDAFSPPSSPATPCINQSFITIKGLGDKGGTLKEGISKINELECTIDNTDADEIIENPSILYQLSNKIHLVKVFTDLLSPDAEICTAGMFKNTRLVFTMHVGNQLGLGSEGVDSLKLELDETEYAFGMAYELEVETMKPEKAKILLEELFRENGIEFTYSKRSKFGNLKAGSVL